MGIMPNKKAVFTISDEVVAREIEGEMIIVPITSGVGDMEDALYTLNETGREVWARLDGRTRLSDIIAALAPDYNASAEQIERDILALVSTLLEHRMIVELCSD